MNLDIWPPPPPISTWLARFDSQTKAWLVYACGRKWRWMLWLSAWLWSMDISNVCPKAMPDFRPSVLLADIQIPICGKGFWMPVKCCLNYYHEIFRDHIFFLCLKLRDCLRQSVCVVFVCFELQEHFLDLSWMCGKGHYYIETSSACATGIMNNN